MAKEYQQLVVHVSETAHNDNQRYKDVLLLWTKANTNNTPVITRWSSAGAGLADLESDPNAFALTAGKLIDHPHAIATDSYESSFVALMALFGYMEKRLTDMMKDLNVSVLREAAPIHPCKENENKLGGILYEHDRQMRQIATMYNDLCAWRMNVLVLAKVVGNKPLLIADEDEQETPPVHEEEDPKMNCFIV